MATAFDKTQYPALAALLDAPYVAPAQFGSNRNWFTAGVSSGVDQAQALSGRGLEAVGKAIGVAPVEELGRGIADRNFQEAAQNGRADLESFPTDNLLKAPAWLGYQAAKQLPTLAAALVAARFGGARLAGAVPAEVAAAGARVPSWLGGGGLRAGMAAEEVAAANQAGARFAAGVASQAPITYPQAVGSMYDEAKQSGGDTRENALKSLAFGVPYSLAEGFQPASLERMFAKGLEGKLLQRIGAGAAKNAAIETVTEGVQTAMEQSFRPDLSPREKLANIVEGAVTGGAVGGLFGGIGGAISPIRKMDPAQTSTDDIKQTVDRALEGNQYRLPGIEAPQATPQGSTDELQQQMAALQQRALTDTRRQQSAFSSAFLPDDATERATNPEDMLLAQQLRAELQRREQAAPPAETLGPADPNQWSFDLVDNEGRTLPAQRKPQIYPEERQQDAPPAVPDAVAKARTFAATLFDTKSKFTQGYIDTIQAEDETGVRARIIQDINALDEADKKVPAALVAAGKKIGYLAENGAPRDFNAEVAAARQRNTELWDKVSQGGGAAQAQKFQREVLKPLIDRQAQIAEAQTRLAPPPVQETPPQAAPAQDQVVEPKSAVESAGVFSEPRNQLKLAIRQDNPAVTEGNTAWLQARQREAEALPDGKAARGALTAWTGRAVEVPLALLRDLPSVSAPSAAYNTKVQRLNKLVAKNGWNPTPIKVVVNHRGEAFIENGNARIDVAQNTGRVTIPAEIEWLNGGELANTPWAPNTLANAVAEDNFTAADTTPRPAMDAPSRTATGARAQTIRQAQDAKLARIAQDDTIGQDLRNAASDALAAAETFAPGADGIVDDVLADYAVRTPGGIVFNKRPTSQSRPPLSDESFAKAMQAVMKRLPGTVQDALVTVETGSQLPGPILRAAEKQGMTPNEIRGVLYDGKVYIVKDQVSSQAELQEVVAHEVFGHGAARALFGESRVENMAKVFQWAGGLEGIRRLARQFGVESALNEYLPGRDLTVEDQVALTDELLAQVAGVQTGKFSTFLRAFASRIKSGIVRLMRSLGLTTAANRIDVFDANDLANMLVYMRQAVEQGAPLNGEGVVFSKAERETLSWTQDRIDREISKSHYNDGRSKGWVGWVDPRQFLDATDGGAAERAGIEAKRGKYETVGDLANNSQTPFLKFDGDKIIGHEGRHRMAALARKGVTSVPVVVYESDGRDRTPVTTKKFQPQVFGDGAVSQGPVTVRDLIPLNEKYRSAIEAKMNPEVAFLRTPKGMNQSVKNAMDSVASFDKLMSTYNSTNFSDEFNRFHLYTSTTDHIAEFFGDAFTREDGSNMLTDWVDNIRGRLVTEQRLAHMYRNLYLAYEKVATDKPEAAKIVNKVMDYGYREIDPRKSWEEHTWLHDLKDADLLKTYVQQANKDYRWLRQNSPAGLKAYEDFVAGNEMMNYAQQTLVLHNLLLKDGAVSDDIKRNLKNPMDKFMGQDAQQIDNAVAARDFWLKEINALTSFVEEYIATQRGLSALSTDDVREKINVSTSALQARVGEIRQQHDAMKRAPYFHIGRFGDYVVSFQVAPNEKDDKSVNQDAMEKVAAAFERAGIRDVMIPKDARNKKVYIRSESKGTHLEIARIVEELQKQGVVGGVDTLNRVDNQEGNAGYVTNQAKSVMDDLSSTYFGGDLELEGKEAEVADAINRQLRNQITQLTMNMLPDISNNKVMMTRQFVTGYNPDYVRSYVYRSNVAGRALASLSASSKISASAQELRAAARNARSVDVQDPVTAQKMQRVVTELFKREAQRPSHVRSRFVDMLRAASHTFFLGLSPAYVGTQLTSLNTLLWPELSKKHGYVQSAKTIAKATAPAFRIIKAVLAEAAKTNFRDMADATITRDLLTKNQKELGLTKSQIDFIMYGVNSGWFDIGTQSREQGRVAEGSNDSKVETALRWGAAAGYYSEMFTRLVAGLSARELHGGTGPEMLKYARYVVDQTMFNFDADNIARATGRGGLLGQATPLFVQFQQYLFNVTQKLMREFHTAFIKDAPPDVKREARRFLGFHLVGMTSVAGTLGLPMAATFAKVFDKLADLFGDDEDEPSNVMMAYRNMLNATFGPQIGNIVARGLPHAVGFDISKRVGEQDLFPFIQSFSKVLTDRRNWEDSINEWASSAGGASVGVAVNTLSGLQMMYNGDVEEGAIKMLPTAASNLLKAYKLTDKGYVDKKGNALPMEAGAMDVLWQALGFNPAAKADYSEMDAAQSSLQADMKLRASRIRKQLATALERGDMDTAREAYAEAQKFDAAFPEYAVLKSFKSVLRKRANERNKARQYGTGLGVKPESADYTSFFDPQNY